MALLDTSRTAFGSTSAVSSINAFMASLVSSIVDWNDKRVTRNALSSLSDRELEDIGLCRGDIEAIADAQIIR